MQSPHPIPVTRHQVAAFLQPRPRDSHKGQFGTVGIVGGSDGMLGAALLAGRAAFKMGAGIVHIGMLTEKMPPLDPLMPELMLHRAADVIARPDLDVLAIGNGLGRSLSAHKLLFDAIKTNGALVLDADALNMLAERPDLRGMLFERKDATVLTPHPGEAARLLKRKTEEVQADRVGAVLELARRYHATVVLKGAHSLIASDGKVYENQTGNPGMSSAGMGDALTGMIAAFLGQGMTAEQSLLLAVHLHGAAGDMLAEQQAMLGMSATEVTEWARWLLNQWLLSR